mgnify:CR=1 FL=1
MIGPNVTIATAGHPVEPNLRYLEMQYNMDVHIGKNVWIGAGCVILPGVTIGTNTVIGAGSIVTKDIPAGVVAVGNPCRVLREVGNDDREYYYRDYKIDVPIRMCFPNLTRTDLQELFLLHKRALRGPSPAVAKLFSSTLLSHVSVVFQNPDQFP